MRRIAGLMLWGLVAVGCAERDVSAGPAPLPVGLSAVAPIGGPPAGGTTITLAGNGFQPGCAVEVGGSSATGVTWISAASATAVVPAGAAGPVPVTLRNPDGGEATRTPGYTYTTAALVAGVTPASGDTAGGTPVTVHGANFDSGTTVTFGSAQATSVLVLDPYTLVALTPAGATGPVTVTATNVSGAGSLANAFTYVTGGTIPSASAVSPSSGPSGGGTNVTVTGNGFASGATVAIGAVAAATTFVDASTLVAVTPPVPAGLWGVLGVTVTNPGGASSTNNAPGFTYVDQTIESVSDAAIWLDLAADANGVLHCVWQSQQTATSAYVLRYQRSSDGGTTWGAATTLATVSGGAPAPRIAAGGGVVAVVWRASTTGAIDHAWSTDGGTTFSTAAVLPSGIYVPSVAVDTAGRICLVCQAPFSIGTGGGWEARALAGPAGGPFSTPQQVSGLRWVYGAPAVASPAAGQFVIAYVGGGNSQDAWTTRSTDGGATFTTPAQCSAANPLNGETVEGVRVAAAAGRVVVAWWYRSWTISMPPNPPPLVTPGTFLRGSADGGASYAPSQQLSTLSAAMGLAVDGSGTMAVGWIQVGPVSGTTDLVLYRSFDGGGTVSGPIVNYHKTTGPGGGNTVLAAAPGRFYAAWIEGQYVGTSWQADVWGY